MIRDDSLQNMIKVSYSMIQPYEISSLNIKIIANEGGYITPFTGHLIRGFLIRLIEDIMPDTSSDLHRPNKRKPFSIAPLQPLQKRKQFEKKLWRLERGEVLTFSISFVDKQLSSLIPEVLNYISRFGVSLGEMNFSILEYSIKSTKYENLISLSSITDPNKPYRFVIKYNSPTRFEIKSSTFPMLMPMPHLVFKSLGDLWNSYSPEDLKIDVDAMLDDLKNHIFISNYRLSIEKHRLREDMYMAGFTGVVEYQTVGKIKESSLRLIPILCRFGEYASVGAKRSYGFGHISFREIKRMIDNDD